MKRALISVSDKRGLVEFAKGLQQLDWELVATGGTYHTLQEAGVAVTAVEKITGFPECLDGRVKTLHPHIHGGILARRDNKAHMEQLENLQISTVDMVVVNLYPFRETIEKPDATLTEAIENIDIGGPSMLRAAAKNYAFVTVIVNPEDYDPVLKALQGAGELDESFRFKLMAKAFMHTAHYDSLIADYFKEKAGIEAFPDTLSLTYEKVQELRYGENPHQSAAFYKEAGVRKGSGLLTESVQLHGKELSFNNIHDTEGALALLKEYREPTVVAVKHANPCGVGGGKDIFEAWQRAYTSDPLSVYGGIVAANREIDKQTAEEISKIFVEILLAPSFSEEALEILTRKKNIRILTLQNIEEPRRPGFMDLKKVSGGLLAQQGDGVLLPEHSWKTVTKREPTAKEREDLLFTWKIAKHVKSNGIVIGKDRQSVGIGPGQVNRIWACRQAVEHGVEILGEDAVRGSVLASDAFFPFPDCAEEAARAGITAIIQPGGSVRDEESVRVCDQYGMAMVFTDMRHFKH